jgi:UDP-N-acetylglucosamine 2-epimerase (non-hydrolysing)
MRVLLLFGTRPEAIKMAPVVKALCSDPFFEVKVCVTGQHRKMLDQVLGLFKISPDFDLNIMKSGQDLSDITSSTLLGLREVFKKFPPEIMLVHGDTTSCFAGTLAAFYAEIAVGHVEAGLRTGDLAAPFPEEANRRMTSCLAQLHFAPTALNRNNLTKEGIPADQVFVTGNTVVDALLLAKKLLQQNQDWCFSCYGSAEKAILEEQPLVLITGHRRENFGEGFVNICRAICQLARRHPDIQFIYPVHLNPNVLEPAHQLLGRQQNIHLIEPLDYAPFVWLMDRCMFILTDSGGIQEEAPSLGKPVLVMRQTTERPEALEAGSITLVGTDSDKIISEAEALLEQSPATIKGTVIKNPYGDGRAAHRIRDILKSWYSKRNSL